MAFHKTIGFMKCMNHVEFFIKCSDKTRNPYKMQTRHFLSFLWNATSLQITSPYTNSLSQHVLIKCQNLSSPFLTLIKTPFFIKCLNRVPNIKNGAHKKRMPDPIVSFFISFHRPKFHHTYSDFCQEETLIKCRDCTKTFPIMNLSGTNQHSFYKMVSLSNVGTLQRMQN